MDQDVETGSDPILPKQSERYVDGLKPACVILCMCSLFICILFASIIISILIINKAGLM